MITRFFRCNAEARSSTPAPCSRAALIGDALRGFRYNAERAPQPLNTDRPLRRTICTHSKTDRPSDIERITVIASEAMPRRSEMLVGRPARLLASSFDAGRYRTRARNCGMDVHAATVGGVQYELCRPHIPQLQRPKAQRLRRRPALPDVDVRSGLGRRLRSATTRWHGRLGAIEGDIERAWPPLQTRRRHRPCPARHCPAQRFPAPHPDRNALLRRSLA